MGQTAKSFFSKADNERIVQAIRNAEKDTSGEIRVHVDKECEGEVLDRAATVFEKLGMNQTELRNGVLFYLAINSRKLAIIGDAGINSSVPPGFWENIKADMVAHFREGEYTPGLVNGIEAAGRELKKYFPFQQKGDINELPNDISFGKQ